MRAHAHAHGHMCAHGCMREIMTTCGKRASEEIATGRAGGGALGRLMLVEAARIYHSRAALLLERECHRDVLTAVSEFIDAGEEARILGGHVRGELTDSVARETVACAAGCVAKREGRDAARCHPKVVRLARAECPMKLDE